MRDLKEEALRVFRTRVVNPKWLERITRHGYKGGLELAATVDYLFGYDATADVVDDWMYEQVTAAYVARPGDAGVLRAQQSVGAAATSPSACWRRSSAACGQSPTPETLAALRAGAIWSARQMLEARGEARVERRSRQRASRPCYPVHAHWSARSR